MFAHRRPFTSALAAAARCPHRGAYHSRPAHVNGLQHAKIPNGPTRIPLPRRHLHQGKLSERPPFRIHVNDSPGIVAALSDRGNRRDNEDRYICESLRVPIPNGTKQTEGEEADVYLFGVFDGHGGNSCSEYLTSNICKNFKSARAIDLQSTLTSLSHIYGRTLRVEESPPAPAANVKGQTTTADGWLDPLTLPQRLYIAFLKTELGFFLEHDREEDVAGPVDDKPGEPRSTPADACGSTASVVLVHPIRLTETSAVVEIVVGHTGDSRVLIGTADGHADPLTTDHVPTLESEQARIVELGGFSTPADGAAKGDHLVLGQLAVSRCFGDLRFKRLGGVIAEPQIGVRRVDDDDQAAFVCLVTDGVSSVAKDQEICDVIKQADSPEQAVHDVLQLADALGSSDNKTAIVIRMPAFGNHPPDRNDLTRESRAARIADASRRRRSQPR
ncbi:hypothetical protein HDU87_002915 [Geranomyces variabilis]|uniref:PPM-type phosphatase domain-containing protein n=1 Tax=Geranomyces variabilis TaxID=109894 RepID=A0AAD5TMY0_9FUNG|nr:hypothetical protein HDU87_002915 [Geranomyces variabilis]